MLEMCYHVTRHAVALRWDLAHWLLLNFRLLGWPVQRLSDHRVRLASLLVRY